MRNFSPIIRPLILTALLSIGSVTSIVAADVSIPDPGLNTVVREALQKPTGPITDQDMLTLTNLVAIGRNVQSIIGLEAAGNLVSLDLQDNHIATINFPTNLTRLVSLDLSENQFTTLTIPPGMTNLTRLRLEVCALTNLTLSAGLTKLSDLRLGFNHLTNLTLPPDMTNLGLLSVYQNQLTNLTFPPNLTSLSNLNLDGNQLSQLLLPGGLTNLAALIVSGNHLTSFTVPPDMTNLAFLRLNDNQLTNLNLPVGLNHLSLIDITGNNLTSLTLPRGLTSLSFLNINSNQLASITFPPDIQQLIGFFMAGNPLTTVVLSEPLAITGLASVVDSLRTQGVSVFTYPLAVTLASPHRTLGGSFEFTLTGPPGTYSVLSSTNLAAFGALGAVTNTLGTAVFTDAQAGLSPRKFYRSTLQTPPTNMVFAPPGNVTMGSPTNDFDHNINEVPQTAVTLTRGFWIRKFEVTQGEYLDVIGTNPSEFPGDLSRPVSSVAWSDATNYCVKLTQREIAAGRIPATWHYRLPTEAEWEYAARAGTSTRFSYGDDPQYVAATNYMWELFTAGLTVHPVGQKLPNPWGLYDMHGNVWEWCLDWYDSLPGGVQVDPTGPPGPVFFGSKVMRGGAYDYPNSSCRSASRLFFPATNTDTDLGFRVVLDIGS